MKRCLTWLAPGFILLAARGWAQLDNALSRTRTRSVPVKQLGHRGDPRADRFATKRRVDSGAGASMRIAAPTAWKGRPT
jgi:hypothetical protein